MSAGGLYDLNSLDWVDAYDTLERSWPYSRTRRSTPPLKEAAARMVRRRQCRPLPARTAYRSTVDYYNALLPLMVAHSYWDRVTSWRYVRPMMIRVILRGWPGRIRWG